MRIVMLEPLSVSKEVITNLSRKLIENGHEFLPCFAPLSIKEKENRIKDADILIVTNGKVSADLLQISKNIQLISVGFTGVDHIPMEYCARNNITVCNSQGYATIPTAELAVTLMLMATRNVLQTEKNCRNGKTKEGLVGMELSHKTVGIVGTGMIGRQTAKLLQGFHVTLLGYDPMPSKEGIELGITYTSLEDLFQNSDFISLHLPLLESTRGLINASLIQSMKPSSILINCARGPVLETEALVEALNQNKIRGAGVDVYEVEPPLPNDHKIFTAKNIVTTPHIAFASKESMERRAKIVFDNIYAFLANNPINIKK